MADVRNVRVLAKRVAGRGKAVRAAAGRAYKEGMAKAGKGIVPALVIGGGVQTVGLALANAGKLSIPIMGYRIPLIGTIAAFVFSTLGWVLRKRPVSKIMFASATAAGISQIVDLVKYGWRVKPAPEVDDKTRPHKPL